MFRPLLQPAAEDKFSLTSPCPAGGSEPNHQLGHKNFNRSSTHVNCFMMRSLTWLHGRSDETSFDIEEATNHHPLYTDTVSASPQCVPTSNTVALLGRSPKKLILLLLLSCDLVPSGCVFLRIQRPGIEKNSIAIYKLSVAAHQTEDTHANASVRTIPTVNIGTRGLPVSLHITLANRVDTLMVTSTCRMSNVMNTRILTLLVLALGQAPSLRVLGRVSISTFCCWITIRRIFLSFTSSSSLQSGR